MQTGLQMIDKKFYYFDNDGYMKTGKIANVEEEDDNYTYYFETKNGKNGQGYTGEKSGYLYWNGKRLEADDDYRIYVVDKKYYLVNNKGKLQKSTSKEYDVENFGDDVKLRSETHTRLPLLLKMVLRAPIRTPLHYRRLSCSTMQFIRMHWALHTTRIQMLTRQHRTL